MIIKANFEEQYYSLLSDPNYTIVKNITLYHEEELTNLTLEISTDNELFSFESIVIKNLPPHTQYTVTSVKQYTQFGLLRSLSEKSMGLLTVSVEQNGLNLAQLKQEITIHPIDSFPGFSHIKALARYITPNHPYVYEIKQKTAAYLEKYKFNTSLEGYQSNSRQRVIEMITSLFYALKDEKWVYSSLSPSYEKEGQRIRLIDQIKKQRFGNCIDLSLVISACLEAMDLNPIVILVPGHAFVGCWLTPTRLDTAVTQHKGDIANRLAKGNEEIIVWEATTVCTGSNLSFKNAVNTAEQFVIGERAFQYALDIRTARILNIQPLSFINNPDDSTSTDFRLKGEKTKEEFIILQEQEHIDIQSLNNATETNKQRIWERKLLDLTLRNSMLNLRLSNNTIQLVNVNFNYLYNLLINDRPLTIINTRALDLFLDRRVRIDTLHETDGLFKYANEELSQHRLVSVYNDFDMMHVLTQIMRNNTLAIDETGANSLYLTMGVLKWYDPKTPDTQRIAPLIMIPVDIKRQSILSRFTIRFRDEEIQLNATLIEFLQQEFSLNLTGLHKFLNETAELNIQQIFNTIRNIILPHKNWEVDDLLFLSNFNFSTQVLWQDIRQNMEHLQQHPIIKGFVQQSFQTDISLQLPEYIETRNINAAEHIFPIDADSSQIEAVIAANMGKSFVLHGPPGSGKSQTITNIIANFLFHGKTVLLVAAKRAALDVVHNRLENIGLGKFTLELHSNKSKKNDVLEHLDTSIQQLRLLQDNTFKEAVKNIENARHEIEQIQKAIHQKQASGLSIYEMIQELMKHEAPDHTFFFSGEQLLRLHQQQLLQWKQWIAELVHEPTFSTLYLEHPLKNIDFIHYFIGIDTFIKNIDLNRIINLKNNLNKLNYIINNQNFNSIINLLKLVKYIYNNPDIPVKLLDKDFIYKYDDYLSILNLYKSKKVIENKIVNDFDINITNIDADILKSEFQKANLQWFIPRFFNKKKIKKQLFLYAKHHDFNDTTIIKALDDIIAYKNIKKTLDNKHNKVISNNINKILESENANETIADYKEKIESVLKSIDILNIYADIKNKVWDLPYQATIVSVFEQTEWDLFQELEQEWENIYPVLKKFEETFIYKKSINNIEDWLQQIILLQKHQQDVHSWSNFRELIHKGKKLSLGSFIEFIDNNSIINNNLESDFTYSLYSGLLQFSLQNNALLRSFSGMRLEKIIEQYQILQKNFTEYTKKETYIRLLQRLPDIQYAAIDNSELTILQRAIRSKGRGITIRNLIQRTQHILPRITPCMLMSPISVAQYLDINLPKFDLVIFDEASQLPTSEAVSAMARGKQVIIVGDPKQMPPTSFFSTQKIDEEQLELEDLESILDDTLSINVPSKYLLRHYRSQHESLITFSNRSFYDNALFTFPSADDKISRVQMIPVKGYYDKGKTRQNQSEAEAVINEILKRLQSPALCKKTIGIVTFSQPQQSLIEDLLDKAFAQYPEMESVAQNMQEPIFIKNLENVQGDERDVIMFSVGYGPDKDGSVSINFGPLNRDGGWRRLNVAITRAKHEMLVFSTLQPEMIDLGRTQAQGVAALKGFLEFASHTNYQNNKIQNAAPADLIMQEIGNFLKANNYDISYHIGQSHFKVDIAVAHPDYPDRFILGLVLDNQNYFNSGNVNDRTIIIPKVLQHLGWNLIYIWVLDWQYRKTDTQKNILQHIEQLIANNGAFIPETAAEILHETYTFNSESLQESAVDTEFQATSTKRRTYTFATIPKMQQSGAEFLLANNNREIVKNQILKILAVEAPINAAMLQKRLLASWSISRAGARIERSIKELVQELALPVTYFQEETFVWSGTVHAANLDFYRTMHSQDKRQVQDICPEEIFVCLAEVLQHHIKLEKENAFRYIQKTLMNARYNVNWNNYIEEAIASRNTQHQINIDSNDYKIN